MTRQFLRTMLAVAALAVPGASLATDRAEARTVAMPVQDPPNAFAAEDVTITIQAGPEEIWSGPLKIGGPNANASFSLSKNEFASPCPGETDEQSYQRMSSFSVNFSMSRYNWQQQPDRFSVNVNWNTPLPACQGEGSDSLGFNRVIDIPRGGTVSLEGTGGLMVRLTRP